MFLPVNQAECSHILDGLCQMVKVILLYSVQTPAEELNFQKLSRQIGSPFGEMLTRPKIQKAIKGLFEITDAERREIYTAYCNDIEFEHHIDDDMYQLSNLPKTSRVVLDALCDALDKIAQSGISREGTELFSGRLLKKQYAEANRQFGHVCPVCVRDLLFPQGEGESDHYFPRKKCPSLTLHPYNILPMCTDCNSHFKKAKHPIADAGPGELRTVFLPYLRAAQPEVEFEVGEDRKIVMRPGICTDRYTQKRIDNMERLYELEKRWSEVFSYVYDDIMAEITPEHTAGQSEPERIAALRALLKANADSTKNRNDFVKGVYCAWLQTKSDEELAALFKGSSLLFVDQG